MPIYVDSAQARRVLAEATDLARTGSYRLPRDMETMIEQIIGHTHRTYRYILLTGMLAKAVNPDTDPLALQAGAPLAGAFDARTLCHAVVVPFEQAALEKRLGGSNEPFLNKPARYTHLSVDNAVRRGRDRQTLERLIAVFERVNAEDNGKDALIAVLARILKLESRVITFDETRFDAVVSKRALEQLCDRLLARSCEGESLALVAALLFELVSRSQGGTLKVASHPANQSGASSNEVSDVDVFEADGKTLRYCCEAKDKSFTRAAVDHAVTKVRKKGGSTMLFVYGPNGGAQESLPAIVQDYETKGFDLTFVSARDFAAGVIALAPPIAWAEVTQILNQHLGLMRAKDDTVQHVKQVLADA
ncbi:restriction endonuclease, SacI family [Brevundimonas sp.]|uniref:restriction endonuclease, SacI family n=1 Tax=Brevundimonas sp. TaxID=1871086 RepID=UPI002FD91634